MIKRFTSPKTLPEPRYEPDSMRILLSMGKSNITIVKRGTTTLPKLKLADCVYRVGIQLATGKKWGRESSTNCTECSTFMTALSA